MVTDSQGRLVHRVALYLGCATNNVAESVALIVALQEASKRSASEVEVKTDSQLLSRQVLGEYRIKDETLAWLHVIIRNLIEGFERFNIRHIPRAQNRLADRLANRAVAEAIRRGAAPQRKPAAPTPGKPLQPTFWV